MAENGDMARSIVTVIEAVDRLIGNFLSDPAAALKPVIIGCQPLGRQLDGALREFGWDGASFARAPDLRALSSRLRAMLYSGLEQKGQGSFSLVYKARHRVTGDIITLKKLRMDREEDGVPSHIIREVAVLKELDHPNIVRLRDVLWDHTQLYLIMDYVEQDLRQFMDTDARSRSLRNVKYIMLQIMRGVEFCHAHRVLHRDLKPQNILIDSPRLSIKVADFGLARCFTPPIRPYTHEVVTLLYRAPEILLGARYYHTPVDMWSLGCIMAELATGRPLFLGDSEIGQLFKIFEILGTPSETTWQGVEGMPCWQAQFPQWHAQDLAEVVPELDAEGVDLLMRLLQYNPKQRITAAEALLHPWLAGAALELPEQAPAERRSPDRASPLSDETQLQDVPDVRGVGRKNADVELAQLADMLPAEDHSTNAATPSLEKGGASTAPDPAAARATAEPPEQTEASSPGAPPTAAMRRQERLDSPRLQRLAGVITRSQRSRAQQEGCQEALLGGFSPPMRRRAASNEGDSQQQGSTLSDRASKTAEG
ncbi:hypothetical protein CVIRNUC_001094 [Coccomyxa viridis]|uniref:cyclin-dependent kinase n=1 Tax=Coccomyxa viridis TaxID=1274662 RepID=A0AAV1HV25_9CHLO|nr:hypothetical protein CVIRNUC_001094 [Coccomyxa viridis]